MKNEDMKYKILYLSMALLLAACSQEQEETGGQAPLNLTVGIQPTEVTRAATVYQTEGNTAFPNGATIGVTCRKVNTENTAYHASSVNIPYTTDGSTWGSDNPILLTIDRANVSAYFPYAATANPQAIVVNGADNVDHMYADWTSSEVYYTSTTTNLTMKHAQSIIRVTISSKTNENPQPNLSRIIIEGTNYGRTARLNSFTGEFSNIGSENITETYSPNKALSTTATVDQWFVVTNGTTADITIRLFIDGEEYKATWSDITFEKGKIYNFPLTFGTALLKPSPVTIEPWTNGSVGSPSTNISRLHPDVVGVWLGTYNEDGKKIYWATHNLNAGITRGTTYSPQGDYYQWGQYFPRYPQFDTVETGNYSPNTDGALISEEIDNNHTRYAFLTGTGFTNMQYSQWRIPTYDEVKDIFDSRDITWTTESTGIRATNNLTRQSVFFGFSGYVDNTGIKFQNYMAVFWTSSRYLYGNGQAYQVRLYGDEHVLSPEKMYYATPIRAIRYEE